jgi:hypothetical protein
MYERWKREKVIVFFSFYRGILFTFIHNGFRDIFVKQVFCKHILVQYFGTEYWL